MCVTSIHLIAFVSLTNQLVLLASACFPRTTTQLRLYHLERGSRTANSLGISQTKQARALRTLLERRLTRELNLLGVDSDLTTPMQVRQEQTKRTNNNKISHSTQPMLPWQQVLRPAGHLMERLCVVSMKIENKAMWIQIQIKCKFPSSRSHPRAI